MKNFKINLKVQPFGLFPNVVVWPAALFSSWHCHHPDMLEQRPLKLFAAGNRQQEADTDA